MRVTRSEAVRRLKQNSSACQPASSHVLHLRHRPHVIPQEIRARPTLQRHPGRKDDNSIVGIDPIGVLLIDDHTLIEQPKAHSVRRRECLVLGRPGPLRSSQRLRLPPPPLTPARYICTALMDPALLPHITTSSRMPTAPQTTCCRVHARASPGDVGGLKST
jgi:hypothetical protein